MDTPQKLALLRVNERTLVDDPSYQADWASKRFVWVPHEKEGFLLAQVKEELSNGGWTTWFFEKICMVVMLVPNG